MVKPGVATTMHGAIIGATATLAAFIISSRIQDKNVVAGGNLVALMLIPAVVILLSAYIPAPGALPQTAVPS